MPSVVPTFILDEEIAGVAESLEELLEGSGAGPAYLSSDTHLYELDVPSRTFALTLADLLCSWQDRFCPGFGTEDKHADFLAQAGDDNAEDQGGDPGEP